MLGLRGSNHMRHTKKCEGRIRASGWEYAYSGSVGLAQDSRDNQRRCLLGVIARDRTRLVNAPRTEEADLQKPVSEEEIRQEVGRLWNSGLRTQGSAATRRNTRSSRTSRRIRRRALRRGCGHSKLASCLAPWLHQAGPPPSNSSIPSWTSTCRQPTGSTSLARLADAKAQGASTTSNCW